MKEYIDREALIKHLEEEAEECSDDPYLEPVSYGARLGIHGAVSFAKTLPAADVVEVVRCKDCKHLMFSDCYGECSKAYLGIVSPWDFCSYGERKEQE